MLDEIFFEWRSMQSKFSFSCPSEKIQNFCYDESPQEGVPKIMKRLKDILFFRNSDIFPTRRRAPLSCESKDSQFGDTLSFFRNPDFQAERGCPFPVNRKIRSLGAHSCFLETQIFQAERGHPSPMNRKIRSFGTPSCFLGTQIFK